MTNEELFNKFAKATAHERAAILADLAHAAMHGRESLSDGLDEAGDIAYAIGLHDETTTSFFIELAQELLYRIEGYYE